MMPKKFGFLLFGIIFGFAINRVGASDYNIIVGMFTGYTLQVAWVILTAIVVGNLGMLLLVKFRNKTIKGEVLNIKEKPFYKRNILGGAIFGIGWAVSGACPGTALVQIGEGKILAFFTVAGLIFGTYLYAFFIERRPDLT